MNSIPASQFVNVTPSVLGAGGNPLSLNAVFLTEDPSIPIGTVQAFQSAAAVGAWFGLSSNEYAMAKVYFAGFSGANTLPGTLYFVQFNAAAASGYLRSGSFAGVPLATLQSYSGSLVVAVDGKTVTSAAINLSSATSPSNAAALIQTGLQNTGNVWSGTLTTATSELVTIDTTVSGQLHVGDVLVGTDIPSGATITSFGTYTVLAGTGTVNISQAATGTAGPEAGTVTILPAVTYDSQLAEFLITSPTTGATSSVAFPTTATFATDMKLTQATGAVTSTGAAAATPAGTMNAVVNVQQNWATFATTFEPLIAVKLAFATWVQSTNQRYAYSAWDTDVTAADSAPDSQCFMAQVNAAGMVGVMCTYAGADPQDNSTVADTGLFAAFACGIAASIDYTETQGNTTWAYRAQAGLTPNVTTQSTYNNLVANGYNCYAAVATANQAFQWFQDGQISGDWLWIQPYINQIKLNSDLQLALAELMANTKALPYDQRGYALVRSAALDPINAALNFGSIQAGVTLSDAQIQEINTAAGVTGAATAVQNSGYYLQVLPASPQTRAARQSPPITLWYTDGGSIQVIDLSSIDVQ